MNFEDIPNVWAVVCVSELFALWLIYKLWKSDDHLFFKISLSALALIPVVGPIYALWTANFPSTVPKVFQDVSKYSTDVYDRWRHVLNDTNQARRYKNWLELKNRRDEDIY